MIRDEDDKTLVPLTPSGLRLGLILTIVFMVVSSPIIIFNPALAVTASPTPLPTVNTTPSAPSTIGQAGNDGDFTTQAALSLTRASQTNNFVSSKAYYDISFRTATAGAIKTIDFDFPPGTYVGAALLVEAVGIGPGKISHSGVTATGQTITYTVTNAVNVPANTIIRIQISNINNPPNPSASLTVSITTRNAANAIIDGPTATTAYNMVQVGNAQIAPGAVTTTKIATGAVTSGDIADGAITSTKPAESFMKRVTLLDRTNGNALGWNPDGASTLFTISEPNVHLDETHVLISVTDPALNLVAFCSATPGHGSTFQIQCQSAPPAESELHYIITRLPGHVSDTTFPFDQRVQ